MMDRIKWFTYIIWILKEGVFCVFTLLFYRKDSLNIKNYNIVKYIVEVKCVFIDKEVATNQWT